MFDKLKKLIKNIFNPKDDLIVSNIFDRKHYLPETSIPEVNYFGTKLWRDENFALHRDNGPAAIDMDGNKFWWKHGKGHRLDGPAAEWADGRRFWYIEGKKLDCNSQEEFEKLLRLKAFW